ncbi:transposase [Carbonactinospora thermoautotrophica]|uniref:transposase n=1 Tax=Carbonactinospora thermoautotrophica TaxID=1469144 RepID=UPI003B8A5FA6
MPHPLPAQPVDQGPHVGPTHEVATLVRTIFAQPDAAAVAAQFAHAVAALEAKFPAAAEHLQAAREDLLAFPAYPREAWRQIWSTNPQERLNNQIRRRTDVVGIFPDRASTVRLVGAVLAEQTDEWAEARRYMSTELLAKARLKAMTGESPTQPIAPEAIPAQPESRITGSADSHTTNRDVTTSARGRTSRSCSAGSPRYGWLEA